MEEVALKHVDTITKKIVSASDVSFIVESLHTNRDIRSVVFAICMQAQVFFYYLRHIFIHFYALNLRNRK